MRRVQVNLPDNLEERVQCYMKLQRINLWAKGALNLVELGIKTYCNEDLKKMTSSIENLSKKIDTLSALLNKLIISVETNFEKLNKSHE